MNNSGYDVDGVSLFDVNPIEEAINSNDNTVKTFGNQTISGDKTFTGTVVLENEVIHNSTTFSTEDGIIEQLKGNTGDMLDYGNYAVYNDGVSTKYKGIINKKQTDKFYVFHNQTNQPVSSLNLSTQDLGSLVVREPVEDDEVATKKYIDSHTGGNYLPLSGGTMSGILDLGNNNMNNVKNINFGDGNLSDQNVIKFDVGNKMTIKTSDNVFVEFNEVNPNKMMIVKTELEMQERIEMNNNKIVELGDGTVSGDAVNKGQLDTKLNLSGGTITGPINFSNGIQMKGDGVAPSTISIGIGASPNNKGTESISLGSFAGQSNQGIGAVAIGGGAGFGNQGENAIAIGKRAGYTGNNSTTYQASNSIILNATGGFLTTPTENVFIVKPIRNSNTDNNILYYNITSGEITTGTPLFNSLSMNNNKIENVANGTATTDAVNKGQMDQGLLNLDIQKLSRTGGTMTGDINMNTNAIKFGSSFDNVMGSDSYTALRGDFDGSKYLSINANHVHKNHRLEMEGNKITGVGTPTAGTDVATKAYVDNAVSSGGEKYSNTSSTVVNNNNSYTYGTFTFSNIPEGTNGNRPFKIDTFASFTYSASGDDILSMSMDIAYFNASSTQIGSTFTTASSYNPSKTISSTRFITLNNQDIFQFPQGAVKCEVVVFINSTTQITKTGRVVVSINDINGI